MTAPRYRGSGWPGEPIDRRPGAAARIPPDDRPEGWRLRVTALVWGLAWEVSRRLPEVVVATLADWGARVGHRFASTTRERVRRNLARVVDADVLDDTVREAFRSYARYWIEAFRAADISPEDVDRRTTAVGFDRLDAAFEGGKGAIVLLAHHGSWDIAARWGETHGYHLAVVAEVVRPRALFAKFVNLREAIGLEVVPLRKGTGLVERLSEVLAANHIVGLLTDRDLTGTAPVVRFFGEEARMPIGAVVLSRRTGAPIVPVALRQDRGRRWHFEVFAPLDVSDVPLREGAQRVAHALEEIIRTAPAQWHAFSPVWLADLPAHRRGNWDSSQMEELKPQR